MKRWKLPCQICMGKDPYGCMICGWKAPKPPKPRKSAMELAKERGIKERAKFLGVVDFKMHKFDMQTTHSEDVDTAVATERLICPICKDDYRAENGHRCRPNKIIQCDKCGVHYPRSAVHKCRRRKFR